MAAGGGTSGGPKHPVVRAVRWLAAMILATWLLWLLLARLAGPA